MIRVPAVYVRKSSDPQEEKSQTEAIRDWLRRERVEVPAGYWFSDTGSRHKADEREDFQKLLGMVQQGRITFVCCWKQDRIGTSDADEWFYFRYLFRRSGTKIIDVFSGCDLTAGDIATRINTMMAAEASQQFQRGLADSVQRARVALAREGMPQSRTPPFGFDKEYRDPAGCLLWTTHVLTTGDARKGKGQFRYLVVNPDGSRVERTAPPRKSKQDRIRYVPSLDAARVETVRRVFSWYATEAITTRGIAVRLNATGSTIYGRPWTRTTVEDLLTNPAYIGSVRFGHRQQGEFSRFDGERVVRVEEPGKRFAPPEAVIVVPDRHEALVDRPVWDVVQKKLAERGSRPQPPRRADLWLRGVLYCGGCGKPMHIFTQNKRQGGTGGYICSSYYRYNQSRSEKDHTGCGRNWIPHARAERLVADHIEGIQSELTTLAEPLLLQKLANTRVIEETTIQGILLQGIHAYLGHLVESLEEAKKVAEAGAEQDAEHLIRVRTLRIKERAAKVGIDLDQHVVATLDPWLPHFTGFELDLQTLRQYFFAFEEDRVALERERLAQLNGEYEATVRQKVKARTGREEAAYDRLLGDLEPQIAECERRAVSLDEQLSDARTHLAEERRRVEQALEVVRGSEPLRKADAVRNLFSRVVLHFDKIPKTKIVDCIFRPEKTEFVRNQDDGSA